MIKKSVLLIDDDSDVKDSIKILFDLNNFDSSLACSGNEAIEKFRTKNFDAVLLDIKMPKMDGYETFEKLIDVNAHANIFFLTGYSTNSEKLQHCKNLGLKGVFSKPADLKKIIQTINSL